jgi:hypothetical protein
MANIKFISGFGTPSAGQLEFACAAIEGGFEGRKISHYLDISII